MYATFLEFCCEQCLGGGGGGGRTFEEESKTLCLSLECCFDEFVKSATMSDPQFTWLLIV